VYNRCIGTRYCSQNCPYKVRRFNFLGYQTFGDEADTRQAGRNPDVTVRSRGVMEKCTYCVQRISRARIDAQIDNRPIADGEVVTACQQACPAQAITFGNLNDPDAQVVADKAAPHDYALLAHLGTRPRTTYLAEIKNPHPDLAKRQGKDMADG
ncbi:MAG: 4Fe-4S dicluster domain-containing protein, partial [Notoacmeibacter sp.]|nr:4Fe-4S dicluster domain-containing protein [Notoacmeibacter sp.]